MDAHTRQLLKGKGGRRRPVERKKGGKEEGVRGGEGDSSSETFHRESHRKQKEGHPDEGVRETHLHTDTQREREREKDRKWGPRGP